MLFDEVVFSDKGVNFTSADDIPEIRHVVKHCHNLHRLHRVMEILTKPIFEVFGFAHVDDIVVLVQHEVHAGIFGDVFQFLLEVDHNLIIPQKSQIVNI